MVMNAARAINDNDLIFIKYPHFLFCLFNFFFIIIIAFDGSIWAQFYDLGWKYALCVYNTRINARFSISIIFPVQMENIYSIRAADKIERNSIWSSKFMGFIQFE